MFFQTGTNHVVTMTKATIEIYSIAKSGFLHLYLVSSVTSFFLSIATALGHVLSCLLSSAPPMIYGAPPTSVFFFVFFLEEELK